MADVDVTDPRSSLGNKLLNAIPRAEYERLLPHLEPVALAFKQAAPDGGSLRPLAAADTRPGARRRLPAHA